MIKNSTSQPSDNENMADVLHGFDTLLRGVAAVAQGEDHYRADIEALLPKLEESGWILSTAVQRIWQGERDLASLMDGLDIQDSLLIKRILELIAQPSPQEVLAALPVDLRLALEAEDIPTVNAILEEMPPREAQAVVTQLWQTGIVGEVEPAAESVAVESELPTAVLAALEAEDLSALETALAALPPDEAEAIVQRLEEAGIITMRPAADAPQVDMDKAFTQFEPLLHAIAAVAQGDERPLATVESLLIDLEENGWELLEAVQIIWIGERNEALLTAHLDPNSAQLIHRILELIDE